MAIQIVDNLPVPAITHPGRESKYPFADLAVNQAFIIPADEVPKSRDVAVRAAANQYRHKHGLGFKFTVRALPDGSVGVWRLA